MFRPYKCRNLPTHNMVCRYHVRLDPAVTKDTRLMFCTTGILLRRLAADPTLSEVSHVVVDEVHERALQSDFLLALLRRLVSDRASTPRPLKIVLMSATIDIALLSTYLGGCPTMSAKGRTFPVEQIFLEDVYEMTQYRLSDDAPAALLPNRDQSFRKSVQKQGGALSHLPAICLVQSSSEYCTVACVTALGNSVYHPPSCSTGVNGITALHSACFRSILHDSSCSLRVI